ncbi:RNA-binding motif protein 25 isoform X3 [Beta vulgaris subsp. vulgaris]|uniref:RNA-binding motif protein 25 isoform X3 n=1 Tax=Beta vulgaris subsp. vulgaris TaxID=3555 RepID=UPI0020369119|nr:RNA-binding motif protein 25 isoform X3 [Beta vulgaris subsp. vulgaris]XP_048503386.1 RNA-binding motif protein 25 isoform X3 [Beta vulgaris subsp. vulgaris]XP_048503387.1 RNA-binding motif protein 25 isoform X3 [Beta vulgaris subsp. vulgaris]
MWFLHDTAGVVRYPYMPMGRPPFLPRPGVPVGTVPPLPRPPFLGLRPPMTPPIVRPPVVPIVAPVEKPQTTVYVGKIAPSVENDFIHSLLELCGTIKSWKRAQDPSDGTPKRFGFCEFESAEGVLRALRLLSKCNVDGEELVLNVNQATREYLERFVEKKKENLNKPSETGAEEAKKDGESVPDSEKGDGNEKKEPAVEEPKKDVNETETKENDIASFGLVTDEDRDADREALEKLTNMIDERIKTKPPPPPLPPPQKVADGSSNVNSEVPAKSGDKDSDIDPVNNEEKNDDETTSETKTTNRAGTESPDRSKRYDNRNRDNRGRDRDRREKERELDRLERERERERARRERERDLEIQKAERFYKERVKEWETREKEREYERKREREKEKERERERRRLIAEQEDESDDDSRKRRRKSDMEDKRRRRRREKEEDSADRLKEDEEIVEATKRAEEEQQRQQEKQALELTSVPVANGSERPSSPEVAASEIKDDMEQDHDTDSAPVIHTAAFSPSGDEAVENGSTDEPMMAPGSTSDVKLMGNAPTKKLGFGLVGSGKRTAVPSVFHEEEDDDAQKEKKMRPLVPIDYSTEELQAVHTDDAEAPPVSAASAEPGKRVNPREALVEKDRSRRSHDRSNHRDHDHERAGDEAPRSREILDAKQLIDMIPKTKDDLFSYEINWAVYDENRLHERMRPWISKKITEFLGEEENTLVEFIVDRFREHVKAEKMLDVLQKILDEEAEMFVLKMWRMLIFEIKKVEAGLTTRPGA